MMYRICLGCAVYVQYLNRSNKTHDVQRRAMKILRGAQICLYPMPLVIVGANVKGKPNYITIAHVGIMDFSAISVSISKKYYTNTGIKENKAFSINIPSVDMIKEAEYCGLTSGKNTDKAKLFDNFYGKLQTAPMIKECPINMECKLIQTVEFPNHQPFDRIALVRICAVFVHPCNFRQKAARCRDRKDDSRFDGKNHDVDARLPHRFRN